MRVQHQRSRGRGHHQDGKMAVACICISVKPRHTFLGLASNKSPDRIHSLFHSLILSISTKTACLLSSFFNQHSFLLHTSTMVAITPFVLAVTSIFGLAQASVVPSQV